MVILILIPLLNSLFAFAKIPFKLALGNE